MRKFLFAALILAGCTHVAKLPQDYPAKDFTNTYYTPEYASGFELLSLPSDSSRLMLRTFAPDTMEVVIPKGGFKRIVAMSSTYVAYLQEADALSVLVGASSPQYLTAKVDLPDVGYEGAMDYETLLATKPELVLIYGIGGPSTIADKLDALSVPYIYISDFQEQQPLGRAEWQVAVAALAGRDLRTHFGQIATNYTPAPGSVPIMLNAPYGGTWFIPGKEGYASQFIADAGGQLRIEQAEGTESQAINEERALVALTEAKVWLCPGQASTLSELKQAVPKSRFTGTVWNQRPDFYESGAARPDRVLAELKLIFAGEAPDSLHYFYKLK